MFKKNKPDKKKEQKVRSNASELDKLRASEPDKVEEVKNVKEHFFNSQKLEEDKTEDGKNNDTNEKGDSNVEEVKDTENDKSGEITDSKEVENASVLESKVEPEIISDKVNSEDGNSMIKDVIDTLSSKEKETGTLGFRVLDGALAVHCFDVEDGNQDVMSHCITTEYYIDDKSVELELYNRYESSGNEFLEVYSDKSVTDLETTLFDFFNLTKLDDRGAYSTKALEKLNKVITGYFEFSDDVKHLTTKFGTLDLIHSTNHLPALEVLVESLVKDGTVRLSEALDIKPNEQSLDVLQNR